MLRHIKSILTIIFGAAIYAFGLTYFVVPHHLFEGGATGITLITWWYHWWNRYRRSNSEQVHQYLRGEITLCTRLPHLNAHFNYLPRPSSRYLYTSI